MILTLKRFFLIILFLSSSLFAEDENDFREIRLTVSPALAQSQSNSFSTDNSYFQLGASVSYFFTPFLALIAPYSHSNNDGLNIHRAGLGPQVSLNFLKNRFHFDLNSAFAYTIINKNKEFGLNLGGSIGLKLDRKKTFSIGPFYNFDQTFLSGKDYKVHSYGLALHFRNFSDAHLY